MTDTTPKDSNVLISRLDKKYNQLKGRRNWEYENHPFIRVLKDINRVSTAFTGGTFLAVAAYPLMRRGVNRGHALANNFPRAAAAAGVVAGTQIFGAITRHVTSVFHDIVGYVPEIIKEAAGDLHHGVQYKTGNRTAYPVPMFDPGYDRTLDSYNKYYTAASERGVLPWSHQTAYDAPLHEGEFAKDITAALVNGAVAVITAAKHAHHIRPALAMRLDGTRTA